MNLAELEERQERRRRTRGKAAAAESLMCSPLLPTTADACFSARQNLRESFHPSFSHPLPPRPYRHLYTEAAPARFRLE